MIVLPPQKQDTSELTQYALRNRTPALLTRAHRPQALPGVNPSVVTVVPGELEGVLAGGFEPEVVPPHPGRGQEKVRVREVAHVFMAPAGGARTGAAQPVERIDGAVAVRPIDRERLFVFDHGDATGRNCRIWDFSVKVVRMEGMDSGRSCNPDR